MVYILLVNYKNQVSRTMVKVLTFPSNTSGLGPFKILVNSRLSLMENGIHFVTRYHFSRFSACTQNEFENGKTKSS